MDQQLLLGHDIAWSHTSTGQRSPPEFPLWQASRAKNSLGILKNFLRVVQSLSERVKFSVARKWSFSLIHHSVCSACLVKQITICHTQSLHVINYISKNGKLFEVKLILNKPQLPYLNTGQKQLRSKAGLECKSMDNPRIKQAVWAS